MWRNIKKVLKLSLVILLGISIVGCSPTNLGKNKTSYQLNPIDIKPVEDTSKTDK